MKKKTAHMFPTTRECQHLIVSGVRAFVCQHQHTFGSCRRVA